MESSSLKKLAMEISTYFVQNSLVVTLAMKDNISAGLRITEKAGGWLDLTTLYEASHIEYVDENGEFKSISFKLYKEYENVLLASDVLSEWEAGVTLARAYPEIDENLLSINDLVYETKSMLRYKENSEITAESLQITFDSDEAIFIKELFYKNNVLVYNNSIDLALKIVTSNTEVFTGNELNASLVYDDTVATYSFVENEIVIANDGAIDWVNVTSWGIVDSNNNIYIAVNGNQHTLFLNRGYLVYYSSVSIPVDVTVSTSYYQILFQDFKVSIPVDVTVSTSYSQILFEDFKVSIPADVTVSASYSQVLINDLI